MWKRQWKKSPCYPVTHRLDKSLPSKNYLSLVKSLDRQHSTILTQLCTGHLPLNQHLFHICRAESPMCPHCLGLTVEMIIHFMFACLQYRYERHVHLLQPLKCRAESLSFILNSPSALTHLFRYIDAMKCFHDM
ncbi:hypothetical protein J132_01951 [Termitomyces sp. J132]|nr:hypothetical protein J132_01951 [Termitomyces sp. J132]